MSKKIGRLSSDSFIFSREYGPSTTTYHRECPYIGKPYAAPCPLCDDTPHMYMSLPLLLYLIGVLGFTLNRKNLLLLIVSIELMLLAVTLLVLVAANEYNDATGQTYAALIIAVAGAESAVGLGVLVAYYRLRGTVSLADTLCTLRWSPYRFSQQLLLDYVAVYWATPGHKS